MRGASTGDHGDYSEQPGILTTHTKHTYVYQSTIYTYGMGFFYSWGGVRVCMGCAHLCVDSDVSATA